MREREEDERDDGEWRGGLVVKEEEGYEDDVKKMEAWRRNGGGGKQGSIAERRRCGFNAPRINTARFRSITPLSSPSLRPPYLTIPPGLSPTSLLDSPVMLPNSQAQPSPTTGTFSVSPFNFESTLPISSSENTNNYKEYGVDSSFIFKTRADSIALHSSSGAANQVAASSNHSPGLPMVDVNHHFEVRAQVGFECQRELLKQTMTRNSATDSPSDIEVSNNMIVSSKAIALQSSDLVVDSGQLLPVQVQVQIEASGAQQILERGQRGPYPPIVIGRPSEDGYNWRKYGQKQVKGSEYPRSYYKCTHPNCQVKKKIERSHDGQITEIIYKGAHNHPKPQPSRRSALGSAIPLGEMSEISEDSGSFVKVEGGSTWRSTPQGSKDSRGCSDWRADGLERTSSTSVVTELSDPLSTAHGKQLGIVESADTPELSSTLGSHDEEEDRTTQGSVSVGGDADDDESESKRRKKDSCLVETNLASRAVREPRVVVQTDSEVDILDDGYRWRKYGQKVVKGNPNPRSYYKCTSAGCCVRKHVERASHDLKFVITTYEGKHNHEVPVARSSSHMNSTGGNAPPAASNAQTSLTLPRSNIPKPEPQVHDLVHRFARNPDFSKECFRPGNLGGFASDMKFVPSAGYDLKLPSFQAAIPFGSFGLNASHNEVSSQAAAPFGQVVPDFPLLVPMNVPISGNVALANFYFNNQGKAVASTAQSLLRVQQHEDSNMRVFRPKQEQNDDVVFDTHLPMNHLAANASSSSSILRQMMGGGFPL